MEMITSDHKEFSATSFWQKIFACLKKAGQEVVEKALMLFYALSDENVPMWAKTVIAGALVYFISPVDAIPDLLPGGYVDDLAVMASALATTYIYISDETMEMARRKARDLFS